LEPLSQVEKLMALACSKERSTCTFTWIRGLLVRSTGSRYRGSAVARSRGMRGLVIKDHNEPTAPWRTTFAKRAHDRTHAFDLTGKMTVEQMQEAAKLGAFIEFDFRNTLDGGRMDAIREVGRNSAPFGILDQGRSPKEYGGLDGVGAFAEAMRAHGFTDRELDLLFKETRRRRWGWQRQRFHQDLIVTFRSLSCFVNICAHRAEYVRTDVLVSRVIKFAQTGPREEFMNRLIVPAVLVATGMVAAAACRRRAGVPEQTLFHDALEKDPTREWGCNPSPCRRRRQPVPPPSRRAMTAVQEAKSPHHQGAAAAGAQGW